MYFLPEAIRLFEKSNPDVQITPQFRYKSGLECFLKNETDILFALKEHTRQVPNTRVHTLLQMRTAQRLPLVGKLRAVLQHRHEVRRKGIDAPARPGSDDKAARNLHQPDALSRCRFFGRYEIIHDGRKHEGIHRDKDKRRHFMGRRICSIHAESIGYSECFIGIESDKGSDECKSTVESG